LDISELYSLFCQHPITTTDSRDCPEGSIFFALKGDNFDGNRFAAQALHDGCSYAVVDNPEYATDQRCILVDNVLKTFQQLARHHRRQLATPIVGITGTNGKTTTKELTAAVLSEKYKVLATQGNFNNDIGVPKTLLRLTSDHEVAVVEMGASHPGDIKTLVEIVEPDCGLITNVGMAHLQGFGSLEGVIKTKGELYDYLRTRSDSTVFIDCGNEHLKQIAGGLRLTTYGLSDEAEVQGRVVACDPLLRMQWKESGKEWHSIATHLIGAYNALNMLAAATVGRHFGVEPEKIDHALSHYIPSNNRSQLEKTASNSLIVDAYNANPTSMAAAIDNFRLMECSPKMAILGDMRELGDASPTEHQRVADLLKACHFDEVWLVGDSFAQTDSPFRKFKDVDEVKAHIAAHQPRGFHILIKGSNGTKLFQLPPLL